MSKTRKIFVVVFLTACLAICNGCDLLEDLTGDIDGWDISACVSGFDVCWELFFDNVDKFDSGFVEAMDEL